MGITRRSSLSSKRGPIRFRGDGGKLLRAVFHIHPEANWRRLTHGFHAYPGRMHPDIPYRLLQEFTIEGARVLDPFCGSGTTLVEAMAAGCRGVGIDILPIATRIARIKCSQWRSGDLNRLMEAAEQISHRSVDLAKSKGKTSFNRRPHPHEKDWFQPHIRYELANLIDGIEHVDESRIKDTLEMILSSILVKVSNRRSHSTKSMTKPNIPRGFTSRFFLERAEELAEQLHGFSQILSPKTKSPSIRVGDARDIRRIGRQTVPLIISSPPYPGTYDYLSNQSLGAQMLGLVPKQTEFHEIGSRSQAQEDPQEAIRAWKEDLRLVLSEMRRILTEDGKAFLVMGTSRVGKNWIESDALIETLAPKVGLRVVGVASQDIIRSGRGMSDAKALSPAEHLLWLQPDDRPAKPKPMRRETRKEPVEEKPEKKGTPRKTRPAEPPTPTKKKKKKKKGKSTKEKGRRKKQKDK